MYVASIQEKVGDATDLRRPQYAFGKINYKISFDEEVQWDLVTSLDYDSIRTVIMDTYVSGLLLNFLEEICYFLICIT